ncbi:hypothetical protein [Dyella sp. C11]|uniref:hypothetical protein n=1 Tax=Dyella sp. C11 TaxID=2126991 RepID=UPI0018E588D8|nr:hypothetical protein [Dyella sp. C11]
MASSWQPAMADDASEGCPVRALNVDSDHLKTLPGVRSVVFDARRTRATLIYNNGDVLRVGATGCVTPMISARLWVADDGEMSDALWMDRARSVAGLVLTPASSERFNASLKNDSTVTHADGGMKVERALGDGAGYSMAVVRSPRDSLGASLSLVFRNL